jgi:hypothetical protein
MASIAFVAAEDPLPGISYTNTRLTVGPWSIHLVRLERGNPRYQIQSIHAGGRAVGLETLSDQVGHINSAAGTALAAINGDYYERENDYAGAPRGLQVVDGELLSAPSGEACFWINALGEPHLQKVQSLFHVTWPDGTTNGFGLNGRRPAGGLELYTTEIGPSTHTEGGSELVLTRAWAGPWLPLRVGQSYSTRVQEIRQTGNTPLTSNMVILSVDPAISREVLAKIKPGDLLRISTDTQPALHGVRMAMSGGPILLRDGRREKISAEPGQSYEISSMAERHPRAAVAWNQKYFFFVEVDGRQKGLSVGMTLDELEQWLSTLGCDQAMNLDGGGSATLWYDGEVRNSPADRVEREIANGLVIIQKKR